ncbi:hypothetical protein O6H91_19G012900 [Diphasiastrum complanatum]|uniref:Uncharacterized protein n=1 Tax=Diphasiastrum complanatum TaxID=34168 RepID=A0ACC2AT10_DIPCM|nr:hypothetical protein O6H91_19G012900 [Diphasiastrum complanatum]
MAAGIRQVEGAGHNRAASKSVGRFLEGSCRSGKIDPQAEVALVIDLTLSRTAQNIDQREHSDPCISAVSLSRIYRGFSSRLSTVFTIILLRARGSASFLGKKYC